MEVNGEGKRCVAWDCNKGGFNSFKWVTRGQKEQVVGLGTICDTRGQVKPVLGLDPCCDKLVGLPHLLNRESTGPIRFEVGESSSLFDPRPLTIEAHEPVMGASSKTGHDISIAQTEVVGRPAEPAREVTSSVSDGFHAEKLPMTPGKANIVQTHSLVTVMSSDCAREVVIPQTKAMGRLVNSSMEVECPFLTGFMLMSL